MGTSAPPTFRIPLLLLAAGDLYLLGRRLWPWRDVLNLPLGGATAIDPAVTLVAYVGLIWWMGGSKTLGMRRALYSGVVLGTASGALLVAQVVFRAESALTLASEARFVSEALLAGAALIWGIAGYRTSRASGDATVGMISAAYSGMTSALMACGAILLEMFYAPPVPQTTDPWKLYQGLAIGNPATQALVQSLNMAISFLLLAPLAALGVGLVFGLAGQDKK